MHFFGVRQLFIITLKLISIKFSNGINIKLLKYTTNFKHIRYLKNVVIGNKFMNYFETDPISLKLVLTMVHVSIDVLLHIE